MVWLFKKIKILYEKNKLRKKLAGLLKESTKDKNSSQMLLRLFLETKNSEVRKNVFKKLMLKKFFLRLSFDNIYPALAPNKISERFKTDFWDMVLKFGVNDSELCQIASFNDFFFAEKALDELLKNYGKNKINKDRMKRYLLDIMSRRLEFVLKTWSTLKEFDLSYDDAEQIKNSTGYKSDIYNPIRNSLEKIFERTQKDYEKIELIIKQTNEITSMLEKL